MKPTLDELRRAAPRASASTLAANGFDALKARAADQFAAAPQRGGATAALESLLRDTGAEIVAAPNLGFHGMTVKICGQVHGGKNSMGVSMNGRHYPRAPFRRWRDRAVIQVRAQLPRGWEPISAPVSLRLDYVAGDRRKRDQPAIMDALFHVLEKAGFCTDDSLLWVAESTRGYDPASPFVRVTIIDLTKEEA